MAKRKPNSQGLSSYCPLERTRKDPNTLWSRVSQKLGDDNLIIEGMGGLVRNLSVLSLQEYRMLSPK